MIDEPKSKLKCIFYLKFNENKINQINRDSLKKKQNIEF